MTSGGGTQTRAASCGDIKCVASVRPTSNEEKPIPSASSAVTNGSATASLR
jgi:hypothetical protein